MKGNLKHSEAYHRSILQLLLPQYLDYQLKPDPFETYKDLYEQQHIRKCEVYSGWKPNSRRAQKKELTPYVQNQETRKYWS